MSKMPLEVGQRVAVYGFFRSLTTDRARSPGRFWYARGVRGTVRDIVDEDEVVIKYDDGTVGEVHPKQCRRLKPPRRIFVREAALSAVADGRVASDKDFSVSLQRCVNDDVEFVEVRRKKGVK